MNTRLFMYTLTFVVMFHLFAFSYVVEKSESGATLRWFIQPGDRVEYSVNLASCTDITDPNALLNAIQNSFNAWESVEESFIAFRYMGDTTLTEIGEEAPCADNPTNTCLYPDSVSLLVWLSTWPYDPTVIGLTTNWYYVDSGEIISSDIEFNMQHYTWRIINDPLTCNPQVDTDVVDVQNIVTHEIGHFIGLDHTPVEGATMYYASPPCDTEKRTLHQDDIDGVVFLYPVSNYPVIERVDPYQGSRGENTFTLDIYGKNFSSDAVAYLSPQASLEGAHQAAETRYINQGHIQALFNLTYMDTGTYTVIIEQVVNGSPQHAYLPDAFQIVSGNIPVDDTQDAGGCTCSTTPSGYSLWALKEFVISFIVLFFFSQRSKKRGRYDNKLT